MTANRPPPPPVRELRRELLTSTTPHVPLQPEVAMPSEAAHGEEAPAGEVLNKGQNLLGASPARGEAEQGRGDRCSRVVPRQRPPPPSARKLRRQSLPRRNLNRMEAAVYVGLGERLFTRLVRMGRSPQPKLISTGRSTLERWDIAELDTFIDQLPSRGDAERGPGAPPVKRLLSF